MSPEPCAWLCIQSCTHRWGDAFRSETGQPEISVSERDSVSITFPVAVAGMELLFDQVAVLSSKSAKPALLRPYAYWNIESLWRSTQMAGKRP